MTARHSTGVAEPVPAVDDALFRDLGLTIRSAWIAGINPTDIAAAVVASEPMQRLRAAWTTEALEDFTAELGKSAFGDTPISYIRELEAKLAEAGSLRLRLAGAEGAAEGLRAEVERLRAAVPHLPDAHARASAYPGGGVRAWLVGEPEPTTGWWSSRESAAKKAATALAVVREFDRTNREAEERAATDTTTADEADLAGFGEDPR